MKIGRNSICPCGSGKKYKRCCLGATRPVSMPDSVRSKIVELQRLEAEGIYKHGHVRPPITKRFNGETFVAVGSRLFHHPGWKTFHDFLFCYIGAVFEKDWFAAQQGAPLEDRHPLMQWYQTWFDFWKEHHGEVAIGEINKVESPPAQISALLAFAYDLYTLEHHGLLPKRLVERLQRKEHFQGARYEMYVAAAFVRAGFTIALEDEEDQSSSHVEFTATHLQTGKQYSVEAKSRHRTGYLGVAGKPAPLDQIEGDISGLFAKALRKAANHDRIVFIDINVPPSEAHTLESDWFKKIANQFVRLEDSPQSRDLPGAVVFFTNFPYHFMENGDPLKGASSVFTGFKIPEFHAAKGGSGIAVQAKFPEILMLQDSVLRHSDAPHDLI